MSSSKKLSCTGTLQEVFICLRPRIPYLPPYTLYKCIQYAYSHREEGEGEEKRLEGHNSQSWVENICRKVPLQVHFFRWRHFALVSIKIISPHQFPISRHFSKMPPMCRYICKWIQDSASFVLCILYTVFLKGLCRKSLAICDWSSPTSLFRQGNFLQKMHTYIKCQRIIYNK